MALIWMDGFDHYGTGSAGRLAMLDGVYANLPVTTYPDTTNPRTGTHSFNIVNFSTTTESGVIRRILGSAKTTVGVGYAFYINNLPSSSNRSTLVSFRDFNNSVQLLIVLQSTGAISAFRGGVSTLLGTSADGVVVSSAYQHFECRVHFSNTVGTIEVRINGVTVLNLTGIDTVNTGLVECSQIAIIGTQGSDGISNAWIDDLFVWDDSGTTNNDFLGDRRVRTIYPDADTVTADWTPTGAATGYQCINQTAPDDETTYIAAAPLTGDPLVPLHSVFGLEDVMSGIGAIAAVQTYVRMRKTEAGDTNVQVSMLSNGDESNGADRPITEIYTYWMDVHETNPNTGTPWSESSLNAAQLKLTRTL